MSEGDRLMFSMTDAAGNQQTMYFEEGAEKEEGIEYYVYIGKYCIGTIIIKEKNDCSWG